MARGRDWESIRGVREARERGDVEYLIGALRSGDQEVRGSAARSLGLLGDERGVEPLLQLLNSSDHGLRIVAVKALGKIGDPVAAQPLYEAAVGGASVGMRTEAMLALHRIGDPRGARMIAEVLVDPALPEQTKAERGVSTRSAKRWGDGCWPTRMGSAGSSLSGKRSRSCPGSNAGALNG